MLAKSKPLTPLDVGTCVQVQNQRGNAPNKWDHSGTIVEVLEFNSYLVKIDGTGRITKRNRQFLRPIIPFNTKDTTTLPNQTFNDDLVRNDTPKPSDNDYDHLYTGPSAADTGRSTQESAVVQPVHNEFHAEYSAPRSDNIQLQAPDTQVQMSDKDFNDGLTNSVRKVQKSVQQKKGKQPEAAQNTNTRAKQVRFSPKRFIKEF